MSKQKIETVIGYPVLNVENITNQVAELVPVTEAQRHRSREADREKLREELDKLNHSANWHREVLDHCAGKLEDANKKIAAKKRFLEDTVAQATMSGAIRRKRTEVTGQISELESELAWWTRERDKHERLLKQDEARLEAFPVDDLKQFESEQKVLRAAGV